MVNETKKGEIALSEAAWKHVGKYFTAKRMVGEEGDPFYMLEKPRGTTRILNITKQVSRQVFRFCAQLNDMLHSPHTPLGLFIFLRSLVTCAFTNRFDFFFRLSLFRFCWRPPPLPRAARRSRMCCAPISPALSMWHWPLPLPPPPPLPRRAAVARQARVAS